MTTRELLVAHSTDPLALLASAAGPVWPVDSVSLELLRALGRTLGFSIRVMADAQLNREPLEPTRTSEVVALSSDLASVARLYAHLTRRAWRVVDGPEGLGEVSEGAVLVVGTSGFLGSDVLDALTAPPQSVAPGLLYSSSARGLLHQALIRSAAAVLGGDDECPRVDVLPILNVAVRRGADRTVIGSGASAEELRTALTTCRGVLTVFTHSDGLDADLGPHFVLCPVDDTWLSAETEREPPCRVSGQCYRLRRPLTAAASAGRFVHPSSLAARAFIFNACIGVMPKDLNHDPRMGMGFRLLDNPGLATVFTSWRPALTTPGDTELLTRLLVAGVTAGEAVAHHNRAHHDRGTGHRLALFGDPECRVTTLVSEQIDRDALAQVKLGRQLHEPFRFPGEQGAQLSLLLACFDAGDHARAGSLPTMDRSVVRAAVEGIGRFQSAPSPGSGAEMRRSVVAALASRGRFCDMWLRSAASSRVVGHAPCVGCQNTLLRYEIAIAIDGVEARELELCPKCGFSRDLPSGMQADVMVTPTGDVTLDFDPGDEPCELALTVQYRWPEETQVTAWPMLGGRPRRQASCGALMNLPVWVTVTMMVGTRVLLVSRSLRGIVEPRLKGTS